MTPDELRAAQARWEAFAAEVFAPLGRADQRRWGERYVRGLLGAGGRKSMEPMAARLGVDRQGLQQFLADSPWSHQMVLAELAWRMEPVIRPAAWVVDDVSFPKDGHASPGVAAQYCGALGKTANCQVAPSVHLVTDAASCSVNWRLFLPVEWDRAAAPAEEADRVERRRRRARIPDAVGHVPKWQLALDMVDELRCWGLDPPLVVADEGYGQDGAFREGLTERGLAYAVAVKGTTTAYPGDEVPERPPYSGRGRPTVPAYPQPHTTLRQLALQKGRSVARTVTWRQGSKAGKHNPRAEMRSRFLALRVRPANRTIRRAADGSLPECWLLAEWPPGSAEPTDYWLSTLPADTPLRALVRLAKIRWRVEHDYRELKDGLGLDHFEGRSYLGWHRHVTLTALAQAFCTSLRYDPKAPAPA